VNFLKNLIQFLKMVSQDKRIPSRDKKVLIALIALIISPLDIIPDWIPIFGIMDDLLILALVLDYFFEVLDSEVLLSHYPWGMKSFTALRHFSRLVARLAPRTLKNLIWKYESSPYKK